MTEKTGLPRVLTRERRRFFAALVANGLAQAAILVGVAFLTRYCFDAIGTDAARTDLQLAAAGGLVGLGGLLLWLRTVERTTAERLGQSYLTATRLRLFDHLNAVPSRVLQTRTRGVMMVRFVADLNALQSWISRGLALLAVAATTALGALAALAWLSPEIALSVGLALSAAAVMAVATGPPLYDRVRELRRARGRLAANLGEKLTALSPVHVFGRTKGERSRLKEQSRSLAKAGIGRARLAAFLRALPDAVLPTVTAVVLVVGSIQGEQMTAGSLLGAILIVNLLASPLRDLAQVFVFRQNFRAARDVLESFLSLPTLEPRGRDARGLANGRGRLPFARVAGAGSRGEVRVAAEPRTLVAITGPSGSGKSTLLALAARLFDPDEGAVRIDGQVLADLELTSVRQAIGMVSAELPLLRGSLRRNLTYRAKDAGDDEIAEVLRECGLEGAIANLPRGLDTRIVEGGADLSAGLRQRLLFARAILGGPRLLLIDDVDAFGLDETMTEPLARILARRTATTLVVTANPCWIRLADAIWRLDDGDLQATPAADQGSNVSILRAS